MRPRWSLRGARPTTGSEHATALVPSSAPIRLPFRLPGSDEYLLRAEPQTRRWFVEHVESDWSIIDVGANVGVYSILAARLAPRGRVIAVEPTSTASLLRRNLVENGATSVEVVEKAVGARTERRSDRIYRVWGSKPDIGEYDFTTLDDLAVAASLMRCDLIKIDVDGYESEVLEGATDLIHRFSPTILIEINHAVRTRGREPTQVLRQLMALGYRRTTILDHENFVCPSPRQNRSGWSAGDRSDDAEMLVGFDRSPVILTESLTSGIHRGDVPLRALRRRGVVLRRMGRSLELITQTRRWAYCAAIPMPTASRRSGPFIVEVDVEVEAGEVGIGLVNMFMRDYVAPECTAMTGRHTVSIVCRDSQRAFFLVLRNVSGDSRRLAVIVHAVRVRAAVHCADSTRLPRDQDLVGLPGSSPSDDDAPESQIRHESVRVLAVDRIHEVLQFEHPYVPARLMIPHDLSSWSMEMDDSEVLRYLYRQLEPRRHFEFGTWEGSGVVLVAEETAAEIWTVNLPNGERDARGNPRYSDSGDEPSDSGERIGWRYRVAGFDDRVHQLLCDSTAMDPSSLPLGTFDTVLVDGGHTPEVVASDTRLALELLRPGGVLIWHDFCPVADVMKSSEVVRGVVASVGENLRVWRRELSDVHWICPSHIGIARRQ